MLDASPFGRVDRAAAALLVHPDIEFQTVLSPLLGVDTVRSRAAVLGFLFEDLPAAFDIKGLAVEELTDLGNECVLVVASYRGQGKASGVDVDVQVSSVYRVGGGVIVSVRDYASRQEAVEAAGLAE